MVKGQSAAKVLNNKLDHKYVGKQFGVLNVLEFSYQKKSRKFYKTLCTRCNKETTTRSDHLLKNPKSCGKCVTSLQKEIADTKYKRDRKDRNILSSYKSNARARNIEFELTLKDIQEYTSQNCFYCGDPNSCGIDRVDSSKNYEKENLVPCCAICNRMKNKYSLEIFLDRISKIYDKHLKQGSTTISKESTLQANGNGKGGHP